ncbi:MAG: bifunctional phosphopantothenoylcysteine decarboxylase/phosphopantothenate--cysteine ligase CoaBC [Bacteroidota bacterium]|nr:bifunctional phosphopantothenoylcysteine decarboxylase/phosphopantothenate--cysteine ligase CoaBC [Bacteroidota bacterium]MDP4213036.1 bifunctional phosphopantothenoylcysteine decarboxylase/phosphopantothenate--cysteine ligase CoaBC [Bacteroidota bacterium]MDP4251722.1 bifunctional phosphopantothenoylcysteine decarboxylase/phosphopantothenate--cysteine ligase CoaBC [Bacteroidota bacterium]
MVEGKKILLGVCGSIAAYKSILLTRLLIKAGAEVRAVMTPSARDFVTPLSLSTISKNEVLFDLFREDTWSNHVQLGRWADIMLMAPLSCNTLAKMANGQCDNLLLAVYLSATCPVVVAPAMDEDMWLHPATRANIEKLKAFGNHVIPVEKGELASGLYGEGRMAEPEQIIAFLEQHFFFSKELTGKKALVTAGPTHEPLDPVRYISNQSTGKMGIALARELAQRGAEVELVLGPTAIPVNYPGVHVIPVQSAENMYDACVKLFPDSDIAVMSAAVADYTPVSFSSEKIKKDSGTFNLEMTRTRDILMALGKQKRAGQILVGFALENHDEVSYARKKLESKNADLIVLNSLNDPGAGFGFDTNRVTIFEKGGAEIRYDRKSKQQVAKDIVDRIIKLS